MRWNSEWAYKMSIFYVEIDFFNGIGSQVAPCLKSFSTPYSHAICDNRIKWHSFFMVLPHICLMRRKVSNFYSERVQWRIVKKFNVNWWKPSDYLKCFVDNPEKLTYHYCLKMQMRHIWTRIRQNCFSGITSKKKCF